MISILHSTNTASQNAVTNLSECSDSVILKYKYETQTWKFYDVRPKCFDCYKKIYNSLVTSERIIVQRFTRFKGQNLCNASRVLSYPSISMDILMSQEFCHVLFQLDISFHWLIFTLYRYFYNNKIDILALKSTHPEV